ncbi:MAG: PTS sugar transporter subunit IIA [Lachnospiraceae bacterium]|nr:PTS sugar transporter subunit IIA [Lachnospiraceae bacterium]
MPNILQTIVEKNHLQFIDLKDLNWQEAVKISTQPLVKDGSVSEDFYLQIISCIEKYGPYMVFDHHVAMPHTTENARGVYRTAVSLLISKHLIDFGKDSDGDRKEANLLFTISAANPNEHMDNIRALSEIFMNEELLDDLSQATGPNQVLAAAERFLGQGEPS